MFDKNGFHGGISEALAAVELLECNNPSGTLKASRPRAPALYRFYH